MQQEYVWADFFFFTGIVASNGDRDGLPNVVPEALASGVLVITAPGEGVLEAIEDGVTGYVCPVDAPEVWVDAVKHSLEDTAGANNIRTEARTWVEANFDARLNASKLLGHFKASHHYVNG